MKRFSIYSFTILLASVWIACSEHPDNTEYPETRRTEDLLKFGLIPEFIGRLPVMTALEKLTVDDLVRILTEPKNALVKQYQKLLALDHTELEFEREALEAIAQKAIERNTGARGLRSIIEGIMLDVMFEIPSDDTIEKVIITKEAALEEGKPKIIYSEKKAG